MINCFMVFNCTSSQGTKCLDFWRARRFVVNRNFTYDDKLLVGSLVVKISQYLLKKFLWAYSSFHEFIACSYIWLNFQVRHGWQLSIIVACSLDTNQNNQLWERWENIVLYPKTKRVWAESDRDKGHINHEWQKTTYNDGVCMIAYQLSCDVPNIEPNNQQ